MRCVMGVSAIASALANGSTENISCPHNGPGNQIVVMHRGDETILVSCEALHRKYLSNDGRGCLSLHQNAEGCPFVVGGTVVVQGEGNWPGHNQEAVLA
ncbi:MAG: hypothetical protein WC244_01880 [Patescibacteria group bacterium]